MKISCFLLKELKRVLFCETKQVLATFFISIEKFYRVLKETKKKVVKKIRGFVDSEFVKTVKLDASKLFSQSQIVCYWQVVLNLTVNL